MKIELNHCYFYPKYKMHTVQINIYCANGNKSELKTEARLSDKLCQMIIDEVLVQFADAPIAQKTGNMLSNLLRLT